MQTSSALRSNKRDAMRQSPQRRHVFPVSLYEGAKVLALFDEPIVLCDLDDIAVRMRLADVPAVRAAMDQARIPQLDRSVIMAQGPHLEITRAITGFLMRNDFLDQRFAGIRTLSRHEGEAYVVFEQHYDGCRPVVGPIRLTRDDPDVNAVAVRLGMVP